MHVKVLSTNLGVGSILSIYNLKKLYLKKVVVVVKAFQNVPNGVVVRLDFQNFSRDNTPGKTHPFINFSSPPVTNSFPHDSTGLYSFVSWPQSKYQTKKLKKGIAIISFLFSRPLVCLVLLLKPSPPHVPALHLPTPHIPFRDS